MGFAFNWSDDRCKFLEKLVVTEGLEARHCVTRMKAEFNMAPTRNAIIGKASRMGLPWKKSTGTRTPRGKRKYPDSALRKAQRAVRGLTHSDRCTISTIAKLRERVATPHLTLVTKQVSLEDLQNDSCRWIDGEPIHGLFCGCKALPGLSYCEGHARRVFDPNSHVIQALKFLDGEQALKDHAHV